MGGFSSALGSLSVAVTGDVSDLAAKLDQVVAEAEKTGQELSRLDIAAGMADNISKEIDRIEDKFKGLADVGKQMAGIGAGLTAGVTLPIAGLAAASISAASDFDSLMRGLTAVAGSGEEAAKQMARLKEVAKLPGLGLEEAVQGSIRLQAVGVSATEAERQMMAFGNALATVGKGKADLEGVIAQLVQMSASTKVVAADLKPIMERVPQAATIIKNAYGTIDTEVLQKMGIGTQELINKVVGGLEKLPKVSGGIKNAFENLGDSLNQALVKIGNLFVPIIEKVTPIVESLVGYIGQLAEWFSGLPAPVQAAVGALVGLAAALGPILVGIGGITAAIGAAMPALTALAGFFGVSVAALAPWALGIAAVVAALTALGVWVYQNWDAIVATLGKAWEGIGEAWTAAWNKITATLTGIWNSYAGMLKTIWDPVIKFFTAIWDGVAPYLARAWNVIQDALLTVWNGIKSAAATVFGAITAAIAKFVEWAAKIPGVAKLMNLGEVWQSAQKASAELNKTATATKAVADTTKVAAVSIDDFTKKHKAHAEAVKVVHVESTALNALWKVTKEEIDKHAVALVKARQEYAALKDKQIELKQPTEDLNALIQKQAGQFDDLAKVKVPAVISGLEQLKTTIPDISGAYATLGVTATASTQKHAEEARKAYETIRDSGIASSRDISEAWVKMETARQAAAVAAGEKIPAEQKKMLDEMKKSLGEAATDQKTQWQKFGDDVGNIMGDTVLDMAHMLIEGDFSFGERAKNMLKDLGHAVINSFVKPATDAIAGFISGAIKSLLSGEGLGGVLQSVKDIGSGLTSIFKGGADVAGGAGGAASAAGGVGGGAGGAAGAVGSGLMGTIGAVGSVVSAISGVISNFQMAGMNKSLDLIENYTRYLKIAVWEQEDSIQKRVNSIYEITANAEKNYWGVTAVYFLEFATKLDTIIGSLNLSPFFDKLQVPIDAIKDDIRYIRDAVWEARDYLGNATERLIEIAGAVGAMNTRDQQRAMNPPAANWTVTFTGDPIAKLVGDQIMSQLRLQGVNLVPGVSR